MTPALGAYLAAVAEQVRRAQESHYGIGADECGRLVRMLTTAVEALIAFERHCPCGARLVSPQRHPHVTGCPVGQALATLTALAEEG